MSLAIRKSWNRSQRLNGNEPAPGHGAGVKRWSRYHSRVKPRAITIKNPEKYLNSCAKKRAWRAA